MSLKNKYNSHAFTLIELLVSVAIVGILTSLAVANFQHYKKKAYIAAAISQGRNLLLAVTGGDGPNEIRPSIANSFFEVTYEIGNTTPLISLLNSPSTIVYPPTPQNIAKYLPGFTHDKKVYVNTDYSINYRFSIVCHCKVEADYAGTLEGFIFNYSTPDLQSCPAVPCP